MSGGQGVDFARTDLISNHTVFRSTDSYGALLRNEVLPVHTFSSFIHEATHHWCFVSPLGTSIGLLYLSAAKKALHWVTTGDESQMAETFEDRCAYELAERWMRPLNEGLAQFAEYDVRLAHSTRLPSPPLEAALNFLFDLPRHWACAPDADKRAAFHTVMDAITQWRLSPQVIDRKSELLLQPLDPAANAYLPGYLMVRHFWRRAALFQEELQDADTFLSFMRKIVYGDYALVAKLLDRDVNGRTRGLRFGQALHERFQMIGQGRFAEVPWRDWAEILARDQTQAAGTLGVHVADPLPFAYLDSGQEAERGLQLQNRLLAEVIHPTDFSGGDSSGPPGSASHPEVSPWPAGLFPSTFFFDLVCQRHLMWLGTVPATVASRRPGTLQVVVEGKVVIDDFKLADDVPSERLVDLSVDVFVDLYGLCLVASISNEHDVIGLRFWGQISDTAKARLRDHAVNPRRLSKITNVVHQAMEAHVHGTNYRALLDGFWRDSGRQLLNATYLGFVFDGDSQATAALAEDGLAAVLDFDASLVRNLAAMSLAASAGLSIERLQKTCRDPSLDASSAMARIAGLWRFKDWPLAEVDTDGFLRCAV
jgi:hypothetical protein